MSMSLGTLQVHKEYRHEQIISIKIQLFLKSHMKTYNYVKLRLR